MGWIDRIGPGELMAIGSSISFAVAQTLIRQGMRSASPLAAALIMNVIVSVGGLCIALSKGTLLTSELAPILWYMAVGVAGPGIGRISYYTGISRMGLSQSLTISSSTPIWGTVFAVIFLSEHPNLIVIAGTLASVAGVSLLSMQEDRSQSFQTWFRGALVFPLIASVSYALPPIFAKLAYAHQATPEVGMFIAFTVGNCVVLAARPLLPEKGRIQADRKALVWFSAAGLLGVASSFLLWTAFTIASVSTALPLSRISPVWVLLLSWLFLGRLERITGRIVAATLLVVLGGVLITAFRG